MVKSRLRDSGRQSVNHRSLSADKRSINARISRIDRIYVCDSRL